MSGFGPMWFTHKSISWSKIAKERVVAVRRTDKSEDKPTTPTLSESTSISSSTEVYNSHNFRYPVYI